MFSATLADGRILSSGVGDTSVSMYLLDTVPMNGLSANVQAGLVTDDDVIAFNRTAEAVVVMDDDAAAFSDTMQQDNPGWDMDDVMPENLESSVLYEDVFPGVDLLYTAYSHNIKEQIIVNVPQTEYRYHFLLKLDNLTAVQNQDGSIFLNDESGALGNRKIAAIRQKKVLFRLIPERWFFPQNLGTNLCRRIVCCLTVFQR